MNIGLYSALSGIQAAQRQVDVASHNIANADTPGYSRQRADQVAARPLQNSGVGQIGTGVNLSQITRIRDQFIDRQVHAESAPLGEARVKADTLQQIENVFGEPSDDALTAQMGRYFDAWQQLAARPDNTAVRTDLRQAGMTLAATFQDTYGKLTALQQQVNGQISDTITSINGLSKQIAELNLQISAALAAGQNPNDLKDTQDKLVEQLSEKVQISTSTTADGMMNVYMSGQPLVNRDHSFDLGAAPLFANGLTDVQYLPTGLTATVPGGELRGLLDMRDIALSDTDPRGFVTQLNALASQIMTAVNAQHAIGFGTTGVTSQDFFFGIDASDMEVNPNIVNDTALANGLDVIAAAANDPGALSGGVGDNGVALVIAQLRNSKLMGGGLLTFEDSFKDTISSLATQGEAATRKTTTQELLVQTVKERRDQVSGVSTDEEMANVIRYQKAYAASARMMSTISDMLDTLINIGR